ncbi:flavodoxin family protein [Eggerthella sinensis]|uniref:flavodoxin family protein n=1 Tax=Eggerthella sinensis TaxID=242230 RepID=UPI001D08BA70|nr:flavodoxin family protein [Eggerthella sinensis]MCB7038908.1 flavodoxin family protein [Eggerthella sinensis]
MKKSVLVIATSLRRESNSFTLALAFAEGAKEGGNEVEIVDLHGKDIGFCRGCLACQTGAACPLADDAEAIVERMRNADAIAFATPVYFYEMAGQMKVLLDRSNPLYAVKPAFRDVYLLATAADENPRVADGAAKGLEGWISCFDAARLVGTVVATGVDAPGSIEKRLDAVKRARYMGAGV